MIRQIHQDLRPQFGPIRDQGARPTCLAFAASDTHAGLRAPWESLSCEFAFYHSQRRAGRSPTTGATLPAMLDTLKMDGQPIEAGWPYSKNLSDVAAWYPPGQIGTLLYCTGTRATHALDSIIIELDKKRPVLILTMLSPSFFSVTNDGLIDPPPTEAPVQAQRHALVAVGHGETSAQRALLVRNSWGAKWASNGYAWLTERFLAPRLFAIAIFNL